MTLMNNIWISVIIMVLLLNSGCATNGGYGQFYQSVTYQRYPPTHKVLVFRYTEEDFLLLKRDGYVVIGKANFNGPMASQAQAIRQAQRVGAHVILLGYKHTETRQSVLPVTQYHPSQTTIINSYGHATGSAFGSGGYAHGSASGFGTSYVTTPGYTTTQYIPTTVDRYDHIAIFLRRSDEARTDVQASKSSRPTKDAATLFDKGIRNLSPAEQEEFDLLFRSAPRYRELKQKAINTLSREEQEVIKDTERKLEMEF